MVKNKPTPKEVVKENSLVIGLDYGTTYTGVAFCEKAGNSTQEPCIEVIHDWPAGHSKIGTKEKVPSEIAYLADGVRWGAQIPAQETRYMWTKLQLDRPQSGELAKIHGEQSSSAQDATKDPVDIIADFLKEVKGHVIKNLDEKYGKELWRSLVITLVVTIPAVWSDAAKARSLLAVDKAGFNRTEFPQLKEVVPATEPESAAIYTIKQLRGTAHDQQLRIGDGFTLCDMGGGTVDLISYRVGKLQPTVVEEVTIGSGDQCGGTFVDRAFLQWLERRLGSADFVKIVGCRSEDVPRTSMSKKAARLLQDFISEVKSGFSGTETNFLRLPSPLNSVEDDGARGICDGEIKITPNDMISMFEFPIRRIYELLLEQWKQARENKVTMKYVFMVGGFSDSPYVFNKIKTFVETNGMRATKPNYAWSAVVRGAATKAFEKVDNTVSVRKCRRFYGTKFSEVWNEAKHTEDESFIDPYSGRRKARNQIKWLLVKGQDLPTSKEAHATYKILRKFWLGEQRTGTLRLRASNAEMAPQRTTSKDVHTIATVSVDLNNVPLRHFRKMRSPADRVYHELAYEVHISLQASLTFSLVVNGKTYGSLTAVYE